MALAVALVTTGMTLAVSEPFPALMGPLFGGGGGDRSTAEGSEVMIQEFAWTDADRIEQLAPVSELYGVPHHFAMNLGAFQFPAVDDPRGWIEPIGDTRARSQGFDFLATPWHPAPGATGERFCEMARDALPDAVALEVRWVAVEHADGGEVGRRTLVDYRVLGAGGSCGS